MAYTSKLTRENPGYFIILVDQSASMEDPQGGAGPKSKADNAADAINRLLNNLVIRCSRGNAVSDYFSVSVVAYGDNKVWAPWQGDLADLEGNEIISASQLNAHPRVESRLERFDDGSGGYQEREIKVPVYIDPVSYGNTPMCRALQNAYNLSKWWIGEHPKGFPPIVLNISDGEATDGDPVKYAKELISLASSDGGVLLFNLHLSAEKSPAQLYPEADTALADDFAKRLFSMSSILPKPMRDAAAGLGIPVLAHSRGFVFNADLVHLMQFLEIGTTPNRYPTAPDR